jgi:hypothetical protein
LRLRLGERQQKYLTGEQQDDLRKVLELYSAIFNGILGLCPHRQVHLDFQPDAIPYHSRPYVHPLFINELKRLCESDVLEHCGASNLATGTFIVPKRTNDFRSERPECKSDSKEASFAQDTRYTKADKKWIQVFHYA